MRVLSALYTVPQSRCWQTGPASRTRNGLLTRLVAGSRRHGQARVKLRLAPMAQQRRAMLDSVLLAARDTGTPLGTDTASGVPAAPLKPRREAGSV